MPGWPTGARPMRVALLSDIHIGNRAMDAARLTAIVAQVNAARPDLVLIAGDFVTGHDGQGAAGRAAMLRRPLGGLHARFGTVAVLGNHDHWTAPLAIRAALEGAGVRVLANEAVRRGPLLILGVDDAFSGHDDPGRTQASARGLGGVPVALNHSPALVHKLTGYVPLLLAGHTHCGQIVFPGSGLLVPRSPYASGKPLFEPRYRCGIVRDPGRTVVVTAGLGAGTVPIRLGAVPDWWLLVLGP